MLNPSTMYSIVGMGLVEGIDGSLVPKRRHIAKPQRVALPERGPKGATGAMIVEARDSYVVSTEPLSRLLGGYVASWQRRHPATPARDQDGFYASGDGGSIGAYDSLVGITGLPEQTLVRVRRAVHPVTDYRVADSIVAAIGNPGMFHDGTLEPVPRGLTGTGVIEP